jgi:hemerythrin-like domain-containing protein
MFAMSFATENLLNEHLIVRRVGGLAQRCSQKLYANEDVPVEDVQIISVVIEEFIDAFHHGKEEKAYFPITKEKNGFSEDIRKFLIEHELGRRIAHMLRRELDALIVHKHDGLNGNGLQWDSTKSKEPVARFLKSYAVFVSDHTGKEDIFFETILRRRTLKDAEDAELLKHYAVCKQQVGGQARIEEMMRLIEYLESRDWL